jgi:hypothetical protein
MINVVDTVRLSRKVELDEFELAKPSVRLFADMTIAILLLLQAGLFGFTISSSRWNMAYILADKSESSAWRLSLAGGVLG